MTRLSSSSFHSRLQARAHPIGKQSSDPTAPVLLDAAITPAESAVVEALGRGGSRLHIVVAERKDRPALVLTLSPVGIAEAVVGDPLDVPRGTTAVLVLSNAPSWPACHRLLGSLRSRLGQASTAIVALLLQAGDDPATPALLSREGRSLIQAGADDVIMQPSSLAELAGTLALRAAVLGERRKQLVEAKQQVDHFKKQGQLFWQDVHQIIDGFPKLDPSLTENPQLGSEVVGRTLESLVGRGGFGRVYSCVNQETGRAEAMKIVPKTAVTGLQSAVSILTEFASLQRLDHPNIVACHNLAHGHQHIFISLSFAGSLNLRAHLEKCSGPADLEWSQRIFQQVSSATAHCHSNDVAHRDIKPENIVINDADGRAVLVDFGLACNTSTVLSDACGSMPFVAPEVLTGTPYNGPAADVWSLGILLLEVLCGVHCFQEMLGWPRTVQPTPARGHDVAAFFGQDAAGALAGDVRAARLSALARESEALRDLLRGALAVEPGVRCSSAEAEAFSRIAWAP